MANLPFDRRQINAWLREHEQRVPLEPTPLQLFDHPPPFNLLEAPEDESTIRNLREFFMKKASKHKLYVDTVMQNAEDFAARLKKRLCFADLSERKLNEMRVEVEETRRYNTEVTAQANQYKVEIDVE